MPRECDDDVVANKDQKTSTIGHKMPDMGNQKGFIHGLGRVDMADDSVENNDRRRDTDNLAALEIEDRNTSSSIHGLGEGETSIISGVEEVRSLETPGPCETK